MISQSDLFKLFRMISRCVVICDECALRFYVCSIFVDRIFVLFIIHHGVQRTYKCFAYVAPRGWIWVRRRLCGFRDIRGSVGRYDPWGIKATGFAVTTKGNHYAAVTRTRTPANPNEAALEAVMPQAAWEALLREAVKGLRRPYTPETLHR